ncbi:MAG: hypothetical protein KC486_15315 [Myxococcales bacterium]|nr:hypothetical protein [Myxococcales bacterium]
MRDRVVIGLLGVALLGSGTFGCDAEHLQERLQEAIMRQSSRGERQTTREAAKASQGRSGLPSPIREALDLIDHSDAEFIVKKDKKKDRTYSGHNFAAMLTTKTIWLGRGIEDLDTWISEIGAGSFVSREAYEVRRPDGVTEEFSSWIERQITSRPRTAEEIAEAEAAAAAEAAEAEAKRAKRRRRRE